MNAIDAPLLKTALQRWSKAMTRAAPELNELDGRLGDGDLGATLHKCAVNVASAASDMPDSLDGVFMTCAQACAKASGSSFGTLLAQAFLGAAKWIPPRTALSRTDLAALLAQTVQTLSARGGASLGDKTMLDSLDAVSKALDAASDGADLCAVARDAAAGALDGFKDRPNRIGRARMFADKSVGMDDPGMVAVLRMAEAL